MSSACGPAQAWLPGVTLHKVRRHVACGVVPEALRELRKRLGQPLQRVQRTCAVVIDLPHNIDSGMDAAPTCLGHGVRQLAVLHGDVVRLVEHLWM